MRKLAFLAAAFVLLALVACSGGGDDTETPTNVLTPIPGDYVPLILTENSVVGENRFVLGVLLKDDSSQVVGAQVHLRFFKLNDQNAGTFKFEIDTTTIKATKSYTHTHPDGTVETHPAGDTGAYVSNVTFDEAGTWGIEITGKTEDNATIGPLQLQFPVRAVDPGIAIGSPIPPANQTVLADVADIRDIDTSLNPIPEQHDMTVAQALTNGKPTVIAFATPAYCTSQVCGPAKDVFDAMYEQYKDEANFIHIEPYDVKRMATGQCPTIGECAVPATADFKLESEPWILVADGGGILRAKFEGIVSEDELQKAIDGVLGAPPS